MDNGIEHLIGHDRGVLGGINVMDKVLVDVFPGGVVFQDGFGLLLVSLDAALDHIVPGIVKAVIL